MKIPSCAPRPAGHHQRGRCRQTQRARARDDQHRQCGAERLLARAARQQPARQGSRGENQDGRNEHPGDPVGQPLDRRLLGLSLLHQGNQVRELSVVADLGRADDQPPAHRHRPGDDSVALDHVDRHRLPGHHAAVHRRLAEQHRPIGRDRFPRSHHEPVTGPQRRHQDPPLGPIVGKHAGVLGARPGQFAHRVPGIAPGPGFIPLAGQQERRDRRRHLQVDAAAGGVDQLIPRAVLHGAVVQDEHRVHRPPAGRDDAQGHQRVHRSRAMPRVLQRGAVERPGRPPRDRNRQRYQDPLPPGEPVGRKQRQQQRQVAERNEEHQRDNQPPPQVGNPYRVGPVAACLSRLVTRTSHLGAITGPLDLFDEQPYRDRRRCRHGGFLGRDVHRRGDILDRVELAFYLGCARGAGHSVHQELNACEPG
jgi:hypothetical protein